MGWCGRDWEVKPKPGITIPFISFRFATKKKKKLGTNVVVDIFLNKHTRIIVER
jgi:hypothetical protein